MCRKVNTAPGFLAVPPRARKPRRAGLTHVLDKGLPAAEAAHLLDVCGEFVDVWKFGWGTAYLDPGLADKLVALREHDVQVLTVGQYLRPSERHMPVVRYWHPEEFAALERAAYEFGFSHVAAGPLVRSSYHADEHMAHREHHRR